MKSSFFECRLLPTLSVTKLTVTGRELDRPRRCRPPGIADLIGLSPHRHAVPLREGAYDWVIAIVADQRDLGAWRNGGPRGRGQVGSAQVDRAVDLNRRVCLGGIKDDLDGRRRRERDHAHEANAGVADKDGFPDVDGPPFGETRSRALRYGS